MQDSILWWHFHLFVLYTSNVGGYCQTSSAEPWCEALYSQLEAGRFVLYSEISVSGKLISSNKY